MNCPYCGTEMTEGKVVLDELYPAPGPIKWVSPSAGARKIKLASVDETLLFDKRLFGPGWFCPHCEKILCELTPAPPKGPGILERAAQKRAAQSAQKPPKPPKKSPRPTGGREPWETDPEWDKPDWEL